MSKRPNPSDILGDSVSGFTTFQFWAVSGGFLADLGCQSSRWSKVPYDSSVFGDYLEEP